MRKGKRMQLVCSSNCEFFLCSANDYLSWEIDMHIGYRQESQKERDH
jgi:hypothetical protein